MTADPVNTGHGAPDPGSDGQTSLGCPALAWLGSKTVLLVCKTEMEKMFSILPPRGQARHDLTVPPPHPPPQHCPLGRKLWAWA